MSLLLDTSTLIWFLAGDAALSRRARNAIEKRDATIVVSAVSGYEIELKRTLGKTMPALPADLPQALRAAGFTLLPISFAHTCAAGRLALSHKDPWDRLLIAQAHGEGLPIASPDPVFAAFGCRVIW
ncbi:MAG: type II toxin-antitoxin system VapC family toxin [Hyphomonadaceae bacterium]|nr:type II toxin-antitoxin system VapC family toxin [Hyphomonadaceae bacterium]